MGREWSKKFSPELENALDDLSNKMNFIGVESGGVVMVTKNIDSMSSDELRTALKKAVSSLTVIESRNQDAAEIIRGRIVPNLKES